MLRFSANISLMFLEYDLLDRFQAARDAGFGAVEVQFPYDVPVADLKSAKDDADVEITVINVGVGDLVEGGPGLAAVPGREDEFKQAVDVACEYAEVLNPLNMNILAGWPSMDEFAREECLGVLVGNARYAAGALQECGVTALVEAVNTRDRAGYLIHTTDQALGIIARADHPNLAIEYDIYHMQIMEGDLAPTIEKHLDNIGHIQFADTPGRHEPGTGEINFPFLFEAIDKMGYTGWLAAEYSPQGKTENGLGWLQPYLK